MKDFSTGDVVGVWCDVQPRPFDEKLLDGSGECKRSEHGRVTVVLSIRDAAEGKTDPWRRLVSSNRIAFGGLVHGWSTILDLGGTDIANGLRTVHRLNSAIAATIKADGMLTIVEDGLARQRTWDEQFLRAARRGQWIGFFITLLTAGVAMFLALEGESLLAGTLFVSIIGAIVVMFAYTRCRMEKTHSLSALREEWERDG